MFEFTTTPFHDPSVTSKSQNGSARSLKFFPRLAAKFETCNS